LAPNINELVVSADFAASRETRSSGDQPGALPVDQGG
jgi:hypothetical protein